ncbi:hypothetical protein FZEAL_6805 [Fusarium zealandicum]|uniref:FAD-binding PCMH-type domain-containing protein n=1 Tax=Fusarium zealandicum TaxID=1053134 RepID=A0A8H4UHN1_9HYPO|nr:hypothetical protein FZEAL_6805 [Fusarium zealandicum]
MRRPFILLISIALLKSGVQARKVNICDAIQNNTSAEMATRFHTSYQEERMNYYSTTASARQPSCIFSPANAEELRGIMLILSQHDHKFAVKSGGYNTNEDFSSIDDGPLISLRKLNQITIDPKTGRIDIGPGAKWGDVAKKLDGTGWTLPGPRVGEVGVGGYLVGGGMSFLSQQYGWGASSIDEMQLVLPNGTIAFVHRSTGGYLFKALKGGGNNFGIVTTFHMQGHRQDTVWGGVMMYERGYYTDRRLISAVREFTAKNADRRASVMLKAHRVPGKKLDIWILYLFYDRPEKKMSYEAGDMFDHFAAIKPFNNTCKDRTYADLIESNNEFITKGQAVVSSTETIPNPSHVYVQELVGGIHNYWREVVFRLQDLPGLVAEINYQPLSMHTATAARHMSLDLLDLDSKGDRMIIEASFSWEGHKKNDMSEKSDFRAYRKRAEAGAEWSMHRAREMVYHMQDLGKVEDMHLPLHMNGAFWNQNYFGRLKTGTQQFARDMADDYDPDEVLARTGGFKARGR